MYGFWPARSDGDDVLLEDGRRFHFLRQQSAYGDSRPNKSLADVVAPSGDHLGAFAVTIHGADELASRYEAEHDDYNSIIVKALADRLAEAFAEYLHAVARREWYESGPELTSEDLIAERYRGIRPAFGYPACPDHSEKRTLFDVLGAEEVGLELTESYAMLPAAAVSGIYLPTRTPATSASAGSAVTRPRTTRPARASRSSRWSAGSRRTWPRRRDRSRRYPDPQGTPSRRLPFFHMKTTLKRGIGRAAELNGNGHAVYPPAIGSPMRRYRQPEPDRRSLAGLFGRIFLWLVIGALMLAAGIAGGTYLYVEQDIASSLGPRSADVKAATGSARRRDPGRADHGARARLRQAGRDRGRGDRALGHVDAGPRGPEPGDGDRCCRFPRDLLVEIQGCPNGSFVSRINNAYGECGSSATIETVRKLTGLPINFLVTVNFRGFKQVVSRMGGVWIDVDRRYFNDNSSGGDATR